MHVPRKLLQVAIVTSSTTISIEQKLELTTFRPFSTCTGHCRCPAWLQTAVGVHDAEQMMRESLHLCSKQNLNVAI